MVPDPAAAAVRVVGGVVACAARQSYREPGLGRSRRGRRVRNGVVRDLELEGGGDDQALAVDGPLWSHSGQEDLEATRDG